MKKNYDIRFNPKSLSGKEVAKHKDFDALLKKYEAGEGKPPTKPLFRRIGYAVAAIAAAITVLFIVFNGLNQESYEDKVAEWEKNQPFINPPLTNVKPQFASYKVNPSEGGVYKYPSGSQLTVPAAAFIGQNGESIEGEVVIHYREMHDFVDFFLSGIPMTYDSAGVNYTLESAGMIEIFAEQDGQRVNMAPGKSIDVELVSNVNVSPELDVPEGFNIYKLDTEKREWVYQEIDRIEVLDEDLRFAQLEEDDPLYKEKKDYLAKLETIQISQETELAKIESSIPKPVKPVKPGKAHDDHAFSLDLSDLIEENGTANAELTALYQKYEKMLWQISPNSEVTTNELQAFGVATGMKMKKLNGREFELTLEKENAELTVSVNPVLSGDEYEAAMTEFANEMERFQSLSAQRDAQLKAQRTALENEFSEKKRQAKMAFDDRIAEMRANGNEYAALDEIIKKKVVNRFRATGFGVWNCDRPLPPDLRILMASFEDEKGQKLNNRTAYLVDQNRNTVYRFLAEDGAKFRFNANSNNLLWLLTDDNKIAVFRPEDFKAISEGEKSFTFEMETVNKKIDNEEDVRDILYL